MCIWCIACKGTGCSLVTYKINAIPRLVLKTGCTKNFEESFRSFYEFFLGDRAGYHLDLDGVNTYAFKVLISCFCIACIECTDLTYKLKISILLVGKFI